MVKQNQSNIFDKMIEEVKNNIKEKCSDFLDKVSGTIDEDSSYKKRYDKGNNDIDEEKSIVNAPMGYLIKLGEDNTFTIEFHFRLSEIEKDFEEKSE